MRDPTRLPMLCDVQRAVPQTIDTQHVGPRVNVAQSEPDNDAHRGHMMGDTHRVLPSPFLN